MKHILNVIVAAVCSICGSTDAPGQTTQPAQVVVASFSPARRPTTPQRIAQLRLPEGFRINVFAKDLGHARMLAVADDGTVYLTCPRQGLVRALRDRDGDGQADDSTVALKGLDDVHGITLHQNQMFLAAPKIVWVVPRDSDGKLGSPKTIIRDLPDGAQHPNRTLAVGADGQLYITVGSSCNACEETNPEHATILRAALDGSRRTTFATGLRNTIGFGWHPKTGQLWGMDHGSDGRGNDLPPEELNLLQQGKDYGWPFVFGKQQVDPLMKEPEKKGMSKAEFARHTQPAVLTYQAHSAPIGLVFYTGRQFPQRYRNSAFICMRGSWNRNPATGYKVVFLRFDDQGQPQDFEDFVTSFLIEDGKAHFARLAGIAMATDGSLLFTDDTNGVIYRVSYAAPEPARP